MSDSDQDQGERRESQQRRRWPNVVVPVILGLAMIALLYQVIYQMPEPRVTLEYLRVLVWPAVVIVAAYGLRKPLRDKLAELLNVKGYGVALNFGRQLSRSPVVPPDIDALPAEVAEVEPQPVEEDLIPAAELNVDVKASADDLVGTGEPTPQRIFSVTDGDAVAPENYVRAIQRRQERNHDKAAIEEIIRESAAWGYDMAQLPFKTRPTPVIEWTEDGRPIILYGKGEIGHAPTMEVPDQGLAP